MNAEDASSVNAEEVAIVEMNEGAAADVDTGTPAAREPVGGSFEQNTTEGVVGSSIDGERRNKLDTQVAKDEPMTLQSTIDEALLGADDDGHALSTAPEPAGTTCTKEELIGTNSASSSLEILQSKGEPPSNEPSKKVIDSLTKKQVGSDSTTSIASLPVDSLHCIASFLSLSDWAEFGLASRSTKRICREVIRRVRLHGFRCATEVVTAWKMGQLADAKELAALYVQSGVPVYPRSLGHSYHTIVWRMGVEIKESEDNESEAESSDQIASRDDSFFRERVEFRNRERYGHHLTYLSEKSLYWFDQAGSNVASLRESGALSPTRSLASASDRRVSNDASSRAARLFNPAASPSLSPKKLPIKIHEHLLSQHIHGRDFVYDNGGGMITPPVSLSVDFFHPTSKHRSKSQRQSNENISILLSASEDDLRSGVLPTAVDSNDSPVPPLVPRQELEEDDEDVDQGFAFLEGVEVDLDNRAALAEPVHPLARAKLNDLLSRVEIDVYSSLSSSAQGGVVDGSIETRRHLKTRFATYLRRLEAFLSQCDYAAFDECMLDFWDEFFPHTAGIHYYDRHTPVPRISCLKKFLTTPCPKSIGVVQCEIERLKIMSRGKGVNVKGRLFPTYEYRLFIRNRPHHSSDGGIANVPTEPRRDTVLMVAKNRGRKHAEASVVAPTSASSRKGSNNYYLYLPQQIDVDDHFNEVNDIENPTKLNPNGASIDPVIVSSDSSSVLLGRLQSNFIGTEFQIFTPHHKKTQHVRHKNDVASLSHFSEDELDYDSGVSSDNTSSRRTRFGRLSRRRNMNGNSGGATDHCSVNSELTPIPSESPPAASARSYSVKRTVSCPDLQQRATRPNRRAIAANTPDVGRKVAPPTPSLYEEEDGVITYTANLLGSRPRIMDVCIPRVTADGVPGKEWRTYLESSDDGVEEGRMLHCFRQIQQRATDLPDPTDPPLFPPVVADNVMQRDREEPDASVEGEAPAPSSPPEDFGLMTLQNRPPWWNVELGSFVLNFGGRVSVASVKNFQLCERTDHDRIMLQFGRIQGRHSFTMDFQHPLSAVQAFSIAISSLQSKISFG